MALTKCTIWENFTGNGMPDIPYYGYTSSKLPSAKSSALFKYNKDGYEHWVLGNPIGSLSTNTVYYYNISNYNNSSNTIRDTKIIAPGGFPQFTSEPLYSRYNSGSFNIVWNNNTISVSGRNYTKSDFPDNAIPKLLIVVLQGGGGGGAGVCTWGDHEGGGGGGAGGVAIAVIGRPDLDATYVLKCSIGAGGSGGRTSEEVEDCFGNSGGETSINIYNSSETYRYAYVTAGGGSGGTGSDDDTYKGQGGSGGQCSRGPNYDNGYVSYYHSSSGGSGGPGGRSISTYKSECSISSSINNSTFNVGNTNSNNLISSNDYPGCGGASAFDRGGNTGVTEDCHQYGNYGSGGEGGSERGTLTGGSGGTGFIRIYYV